MITEAIALRIECLREESKNCNARWFCDNRVPVILDTLAALLKERDGSSDPHTPGQLREKHKADAAVARFTSGPVVR